jgi:hypothetical protein
MSYKVGDYKGYSCFQLEDYQSIPAITDAIYITTTGSMYFGGVKVGKVQLPGYRVVDFDMGIYEAHKRAQETRKRETAVPAPASVADATVTLAVGEEQELTGTDEFFARIALAIEETLKGVKDFNGE